MSDINRRAFGQTTFMGITGLALGRREQPAPKQADASRVYRYVHLDVFTERRLEGNQLFVFPQPAGLDTGHDADDDEGVEPVGVHVRVSARAGGNRSSRAHLYPHRRDAVCRSPDDRDPFALAHNGVLKPAMARTTFGLGVGPIVLDLDWKDGHLAFAWMAQLKPTFGKTITDASGLAAAIGVDALDSRAPGQEVNCGSNFFIVPLASRKAVDAAVLDRPKADALFTAAGIQRRGIYVFSTEKAGDDVTAYSRMLPAGGIEDPATGSAVGPAGCFAAKYGFVARDRIGSMKFLQGVLAKRPSHLHVRVTMNASEVTAVQVGGPSVVVGEG